MARAHTLDACLRCESLIKHFTNSTTLPSRPAWLFGPHHSPQSKPVFIKLLWNVGKADTEEVGVYLGGAKYFIAPSIAHCDWVVYAVNAGDKPMGHWLLVVPAWWSLATKKKKILSDPSVRRPTWKMPGMPDYQSSPASDRPIACRERLIASRFPLYTERTLHDKRCTTKLKFGPTQKTVARVRIRLKIGRKSHSVCPV